MDDHALLASQLVVEVKHKSALITCSRSLQKRSSWVSASIDYIIVEAERWSWRTPRWESRVAYMRTCKWYQHEPNLLRRLRHPARTTISTVDIRRRLSCSRLMCRKTWNRSPLFSLRQRPVFLKCLVCWLQVVDLTRRSARYAATFQVYMISTHSKWCTDDMTQFTTIQWEVCCFGCRNAPS